MWLAAGLVAGCGLNSPTAAKPAATNAQASSKPTATNAASSMKEKIVKSEEEWKKELTPEQYRVLREKGTERAFTGAYWNNHEAGRYFCAGCGLELFASDAKFDSGCGWPSFHSPAKQDNLATTEDRSHFMERTEVLCSRCGGHLGHVFDDGPKPTGLRYCINSAAIKFEKAEKK